MPFVIDLKLNKIASTLFEKNNEYWWIYNFKLNLMGLRTKYIDLSEKRYASYMIFLNP